MEVYFRKTNQEIRYPNQLGMSSMWNKIFASVADILFRRLQISVGINWNFGWKETSDRNFGLVEMTPNFGWNADLLRPNYLEIAVATFDIYRFAKFLDNLLCQTSRSGSGWLFQKCTSKMKKVTKIYMVITGKPINQTLAHDTSGTEGRISMPFFLLVRLQSSSLIYVGTGKGIYPRPLWPQSHKLINNLW